MWKVALILLFAVSLNAQIIWYGSGTGEAEAGGGETLDSTTITITDNTWDGEDTDVLDAGADWEVNGSYDNNSYIWDGGSGDNAAVGYSFPLDSNIPANANITKMYLRCYFSGDNSGAVDYFLTVENSDPATAAIWDDTDHHPGTSTFYGDSSAQQTTFGTGWYFGEDDTNPQNLEAYGDSLIADYGAIASSDIINVVVYPITGQGGNYGAIEDYSDTNSNHASLKIVWSVSE